MRSPSLPVGSLSPASACIITSFPVYDTASGASAAFPLLGLVDRAHVYCSGVSAFGPFDRVHVCFQR